MKTDFESKKANFHHHVGELQEKISQELFKLDPALKLTEDLWDRLDHLGLPGGGGITRAFSGDIIENAGVNTSLVFGNIDPKFASSLGGTGNTMWACGISLIIHPRNPRVPTVHANFRMIDLTPFYPHIDDFEYFHKVWKDALTPFGLYEKMKSDCDTYFMNTHRNNEMRGIGGFFFDHFNTDNLDSDLSMVKKLSTYFIDSYFPIVAKRKDEAFQLHRRGRYVEFNLLHDRGTMFGLKTNGRTDSILISLPARAKYTYKYAPKPGSVHEKMMEYYHPREWK
jgi:coproporphyrinogen III oxidase